MTNPEFNTMLGRMDQIKEIVIGSQKDLENMAKILQAHSTELWGDTSESKPGLVKKVDRIVEKQKDRNKMFVIFGSIVSFLGIEKIYKLLEVLGFSSPKTPH